MLLKKYYNMNVNEVMIFHLLTLKRKSMQLFFIFMQLLPNSVLSFYISLLKLHKMSNMQTPTLTKHQLLLHKFFII